MDYEIIIAHTAFRDLEKIGHFISRDNPERARSFCQQLLDKSMSLDRSPYQGSVIPGRKNGRFVVMKSYLIVYRIVEETKSVRVLRFWHSARDYTRMSLGEGKQ